MYDELIKRLRECTAEQNGEKTLWHQAADAIEDLDNRLNLHRQGKIGHWIPVTEKLPEKEDEAVIVWEKQGFALIDWRHDNKWAILDNNCGIATHWMPLPNAPEPPKEET